MSRLGIIGAAVLATAGVCGVATVATVAPATASALRATAGPKLLAVGARPDRAPRALAGTRQGPRPGSQRDHKTVQFTGHYTGTASLLIVNDSATGSVSGSGTGTLIGASKVAGSGSTGTATATCPSPIPFSGTGSLTGAAGKITFTVIRSQSSGCSSGESGSVTITFSGVLDATGGTGVARGASGHLSFKGTMHLGNTTGHQSGSYKVTLHGSLTVKA